MGGRTQRTSRPDGSESDRARSRPRSEWARLARFALVGASGYVVNLLAFSGLTQLVGFGHIAAGVGAFLVAVSNNFVLNRVWTFDAASGAAGPQALRFLTVSLAGLLLNLLLLEGLIRAASAPEVLAQAVAVALVTPVNFLGNRLWTFRDRGESERERMSRHPHD